MFTFSKQNLIFVISILVNILTGCHAKNYSAPATSLSCYNNQRYEITCFIKYDAHPAQQMVSISNVWQFSNLVLKSCKCPDYKNSICPYQKEHPFLYECKGTCKWIYEKKQNNQNQKICYNNTLVFDAVVYEDPIITGCLTQDNIQFGQLKIKDQQFLSVNQFKFKKDGLFSVGLLNLGINKDKYNYIFNMKQQKLIKSAEYSLYIPMNYSSPVNHISYELLYTLPNAKELLKPEYYNPVYLMVGGGLPVPENSFIAYDASKYANNYMWALKLDRFELTFKDNTQMNFINREQRESNDKSLESIVNFDVDAPGISLPPGFTRQLKKKINKIYKDEMYCIGQINVKCYMKKQVQHCDNFPDIIIKFSEHNNIFTLKSRDYVRRLKMLKYGTVCSIQVQSTFAEGFFVIGYEFQRRYYTVYDIDNQLIKISNISTEEYQKLGQYRFNPPKSTAEAFARKKNNKKVLNNVYVEQGENNKLYKFNEEFNQRQQLKKYQKKKVQKKLYKNLEEIQKQNEFSKLLSLQQNNASGKDHVQHPKKKSDKTQTKDMSANINKITKANYSLKFEYSIYLSFITILLLQII